VSETRVSSVEGYLRALSAAEDSTRTDLARYAKDGLSSGQPPQIAVNLYDRALNSRPAYAPTTSPPSTGTLRTGPGPVKPAEGTLRPNARLPRVLRVNVNVFCGSVQEPLPQRKLVTHLV
jgi:hypothetical protein